MKKNKRSNQPAQTAPVSSSGPLLSKKSIQWIGGGIVLLIIGYVVLSFADSKAQNLPGKLSPFLILGGYGAIGYALFINRKQPTPPHDPSKR